MFSFLLVVHSLIAAALVGVILMQRSEGGGFAGGGSPTGLLSARGAGDFLTRTTAILATLFILLSIGLSALATVNRRPTVLDNSLKRAPISNPAAAIPSVPMAGGAAPASAPEGSVAPAAPLPAQAQSANGSKDTERTNAATVTRDTPREESRAPARDTPEAKPAAPKSIVITPRAPVAVPKVVATPPVAPKIEVAPPTVNVPAPATDGAPTP
jgi:preprotein translocase subunit SecG